MDRVVAEDALESVVNPDEDRARGFTLSDNGIVVLGKGEVIKA